MNLSPNELALAACTDFYHYHRRQAVKLPSYAESTKEQRDKLVMHEVAMKLYLETWEKLL
jgi:hypothetical protein